jgi:hypothetical protein
MPVGLSYGAFRSAGFREELIKFRRTFRALIADTATWLGLKGPSHTPTGCYRARHSFNT